MKESPTPSGDTALFLVVLAEFFVLGWAGNSLYQYVTVHLSVIWK